MPLPLKPCPFCGAQPAYDHTRPDGVRFTCLTCDDAAFEDFEAAATYWNTRADPHALCAHTRDQMANTVASVATSGASVAPVATSR